jgi:hypothetical protein
LNSEPGSDLLHIIIKVPERLHFASSATADGSMLVITCETEDGHAADVSVRVQHCHRDGAFRHGCGESTSDIRRKILKHFVIFNFSQKHFRIKFQITL